MSAVLYVEDDPASRRIFEMLFKKRMQLPHVTIFEDSTDFITRVKTLDPKPDVIFLDINIKPHDGFEMLEMLRGCDDFQRTPIVALTASVMNEQVQQLKNSGFSGVVAKPINISTFPTIFSRVLSGESIWYIVD